MCVYVARLWPVSVCFCVFVFMYSCVSVFNCFSMIVCAVCVLEEFLDVLYVCCTALCL